MKKYKVKTKNKIRKIWKINPRYRIKENNKEKEISKQELKEVNDWLWRHY